MLTDKCKEEFEKWFESIYDNNNTSEVIMLQTEFDIAPLEFQYSVYQDFFLSKDILLDVHPLLDYDENVYTKVLHYMVSVIILNIESSDCTYLDDEFNSLSDARIEAINQANKIYNEIT